MSHEYAAIESGAIHGTTGLTCGLTFRSGVAATAYIKHYCFNQNRQCKVIKSSGRSKTYVCPQDGCPWEVRVTKREWVGGTPEFYVSTFIDRHSDVCMAVGIPSARQIQLLPTFDAAVRGDKDIKHKSIVALVQARDGTNLQQYRSKMYRAKDAVVNDMEGEWKSYFPLLTPHLLELMRINPGSFVALDVDQHNRFFRFFVVFEVAVNSHPFNIPVVGFDGTHSRHGKYNGVILSLIGRDGNGQNVKLASAFVHVENKDIVAWFFIQCINGGINFKNVAVMCDRGKIQEAVKLVWLRTGVSVQIRFCTLHILRNVKRNFGCSGREFENAMWKLQSSETEVDYNEALTAIHTNHGDNVATYLSEIDPIYWTVFANMPSGGGDYVDSTSSSGINSEDTHRMARNLSYDNNMPPMTPCPLFGWRTTKIVESDNNTILVNGIRDATPLEAIRILTKAAMDKFSMRQDQIKKWTSQGLTITPRARALWKTEQKAAGNYEVSRSAPGVWFASKQGYATYRRVETEALKCSCSTFNQMGLPCRHIVAVLHTIGSTIDMTQAFHPSYLVKTFKQGFEERSIEVVVSTKPPAVFILPPPYYKNAGRRQKRRIGSSGDTKPGVTYKCRSCTQARHNSKTCRRHANFIDERNDAFVSQPIDLVNMLPSLIPGPQVMTTTEVPDNTPNGFHARGSIAFILN